MWSPTGETAVNEMRTLIIFRKKTEVTRDEKQCLYCKRLHTPTTISIIDVFLGRIKGVQSVAFGGGRLFLGGCYSELIRKWNQNKTSSRENTFTPIALICNINVVNLQNKVKHCNPNKSIICFFVWIIEPCNRPKMIFRKCLFVNNKTIQFD